jgi:hypothetical protein
MSLANRFEIAASPKDPTMNSPFRRIHPRVPGRIALVALGMLIAADAHAFEPDGAHKTITNKVAGDLGYSASAQAALVKGNTDTDKKEDEAAGGEWYSPAAHFDNEAFSAGALRLRNKRDLALASLETCDWNVSLEAMGRALHAIQDFYSHSNWVTIHPDPGKFADLFNLADPSDSDRARKVNCVSPAQGDPLTSGYYRYSGAELAANTQLWVRVPANRCLHDSAGALGPGLHKDGDTRAGYDAAKTRATAATKAFILAMEASITSRYGADMVKYLKSDGSSDRLCHDAHLARRSEVLRKTRPDVQAFVMPGSGHWGSWRHAPACPAGTWAKGFSLRRETYQGPEIINNDDSALNSVKLICSNDDEIDPKGGPWGKWATAKLCSAGKFLTAANLKVEPPQATKDDSAANDVVFECSDKKNLSIPPTDTAGTWGKEGGMVACPVGTAVCGLSVRVEDPQGDGNNDDTAMNGLALHCCTL